MQCAQLRTVAHASFKMLTSISTQNRRQIRRFKRIQECNAIGAAAFLPTDQSVRSDLLRQPRNDHLHGVEMSAAKRKNQRLKQSRVCAARADKAVVFESETVKRRIPDDIKPELA